MVRGSHARDMVSDMIMRNAMMEVSDSDDTLTSSDEEEEEDENWIEEYDEEQMAHYYVNRHTMETRWDRPLRHKPHTSDERRVRRRTKRKSSVVYVVSC